MSSERIERLVKQNRHNGHVNINQKLHYKVSLARSSVDRTEGDYQELEKYYLQETVIYIYIYIYI